MLDILTLKYAQIDSFFCWNEKLIRGKSQYSEGKTMSHDIKQKTADIAASGLMLLAGDQ